MKLADLIDHLIELQNTYGNLDVYHHDCEWGIDAASPGLSKVILEGEHLVNFDATTDRSVIHSTLEELNECWDQSEDYFRGMYKSREDFIVQSRKMEADRDDLLRRIEEAPYSIVF